MTIASEITRLQGAKADIKTAIEGKGVTVPANAKLDTYDDYIEQINTGTIPTMFTPAALSYPRVYQNDYNTMWGQPGALIYEGLNPGGTAYLNYFFSMAETDASSSSTGNPHIFILSKSGGSDGTVSHYVGPQYYNNSSYNFPTVYDAFAINENGTLKVYIIYTLEHITSKNYSGSDVGIWDVTSGCTTLDSVFVPALSPSGIDYETINETKEQFRQDVGYYTYPVLSNGGATSTPSIDWTDHYYGFTYTLNLV